MSTITMDFRHNYQRGERRDSDQDTYQWDLGHVLEIYVPATATYEIHYCLPGFTETEDYAVESCTASDDGGYKLTAHVPNKFFEESGRLQLFVVGSADNHIITTYEGYINIISRVKPDDYTDDDPENGAISILAKAREYANQSEAWAVGEIEGEAVPSTAPQYHNNSEYYAGLAAGSASDASDSAGAASGSASSASTNALKAEGYAVGKQNGTDVASGSDYYHNNASYYAGQASGSATAASNSANAASASELNAEAWAQGTKNGVPVTSSDPQYHKSAQYVADTLSADIAGLQAQIDRILTEIGIAVEADHTSMTAAHSAGEYVYSEGHLYRLLKNLAVGTAIVTGTGTQWDSAVETTISDDLVNKVLVLPAVTVNAVTSGDIIDYDDARIRADHYVARYVFADSSAVTAITSDAVTTNGNITVSGTCTSATTAWIMLVR